jgi:O-methyltransferase
VTLRTTAKSIARQLTPWGLRFVNRGMRYPPYGSDAVSEVGTSLDKVRIASIALALHRIDSENIEGAMAELGVYRGELSRVLHKLSPTRTLYLFDTFKGFQDGGDERFRDTSPELVLKHVGGDSRKVRIRQGFFPKTSEGLEDEKFAFVMLDGDRYDVTLAGLEFFMPRLVKGGYLFAHDFNNPESSRGVSRACADYFKGAKPYVEIPDRWGSVVLRCP